MASTSMATFDMEQILSTRIDLTQREKTSIKESLEQIDAKIKVSVATIGQKPRETEEEVAATMKELERVHSTTPQTSASDRQFMRDLDKLRQKRKSIEEYQVNQAALDELKTRRAELQKELKEKDRTLDELQAGLRRLKIATKLNCNTSDIVEQKFTVPESKMAQIIGKGGSNLRLVESEHNVSIDTERTGGVLRIIGTEATIAAAHNAILTIVNTNTEEITAPEETFVCLMFNKAELTHDIQTRLNVRLDVSRAKKVCKIIGLTENIHRAMSEIKSIDSAREEVSIEARVLPFIMGKGGATIRALGDSHRAQIDIAREENRIIVMGYREDVSKVASTLRSIVEDNVEVEERISIDKQVMLGCIIGNGGATIRNLQKDLNVQMKTEKGEQGSPDSLVIRGNTAKTIAAKAHVERLLEEYIKNTESMPMAEDLLPLIVGKKGARIKQIREEHPDAIIDIDELTVNIHSKDPAVRLSVRNAINEVVANNFTKTVKVPADIVSLLKGQKGADLRNQLTNDLSLTVDIIAEEEAVKLRGPKHQVDKAVEIIEAFEAGNVTAFVACSSEDCSILLTGGNDAPFKALESEFAVDIFVSKKDCSARIRGPEDAVLDAKAALVGLLKGDINRGSCVININHAAFSSIIGKGGSTHRKFEADYNVKIDLLKSVDQLRLRGTAEDIARAKRAVIEFLDDIRVTAKVEIPKPAGDAPPVAAAHVEKVINTVSSLYHVEITKDANQLTIKGHLNLVEEAKKHLIEQLEGKSVCKLSILPHQVEVIRSHGEASFQMIERKHHVKIDIKDEDEQKPSIAIQGPTSPVGNAKIELFRFLDTMFPSEFASVAMGSSCLREIGSTRSLSDIQEKAGNVVLTVDRPLSCIRIRGDAEAVATAMAIIRDELAAWKEHHANVDVEEFMLPAIVGKNGTTIMALQKEMGVSVHINRDIMRVEVSGTDKEAVAETAQKLRETVERLRAGYWETLIENDLIGLVIGKQGAHIKKLRADTGATIEVDPKSGVLKVSGDPDKVRSARDLIEDFLRDQRKTNHVIQLRVPTAAFPFIIGAKGAVAQEIQHNSGAKFDLDRNKNLAIIRGSPEACSRAAQAVTEILDREGFGIPKAVDNTSSASGKGAASASAPAQAADDDSDEESEASGSVEPSRSFAKIPPGASPELIAQLSLQEKAANMSKSAARRLRRKAQQQQEQDRSSTPDSLSPSLSSLVASITAKETSCEGHAEAPVQQLNVKATAVAIDALKAMVKPTAIPANGSDGTQHIAAATAASVAPTAQTHPQQSKTSSSTAAGRPAHHIVPGAATGVSNGTGTAGSGGASSGSSSSSGSTHTTTSSAGQKPVDNLLNMLLGVSPSPAATTAATSVSSVSKTDRISPSATKAPPGFSDPSTSGSVSPSASTVSASVSNGIVGSNQGAAAVAATTGGGPVGSSSSASNSNNGSYYKSRSGFTVRL